MFDPTGAWRYRLERAWDDGPAVAFVMLNPNTADAEHDDPTIRRCVGFARRWGFGRLLVVNLFAWCCPRPSMLREAEDPVGPRNDTHLRRAATEADRVVVAWGNHGRLLDRDREVTETLDGPLYCLGTTRHGCPRHPLYLAADTPLERYAGR